MTDSAAHTRSNIAHPARRVRLRTIAVAAAAVLLVGAVIWSELRATEVEAEHAYAIGRWSVAYSLSIDQLQRWPGSRSLHLLAARSAARIGQCDVAAGHFAQVAPSALDDLQLQLECVFRLRDWDEVARIAERVLTLAPNDARATQRLAYTHYQRGESAKAIALCREAVNDPRHGLSVRGMLASMLLERIDYEHAADEFEAIIRANPNGVDLPVSLEQVYLGLATCLWQMGDSKRAEMYLTDAVRRWANPAIAWRLGQALQQQGRNDEAAERWSDAIRWDPNYAPALIALGELALEEKDPDRALGHLSRAERAEPDNSRAHYALARAFTALGDHDQSRTHRERADLLRKEEDARTKRLGEPAAGP